MRVYYAAGPGDVVGTFRQWREGRDDRGQVAVTYSGQFYSACRELGARGLAVGSHGGADREADGPIAAENRPAPAYRSGAGYHRAMLVQAWRTSASAWRFGADVAVVSGDTTHAFLLTPLAFLGVRVVPTLHCVLYPKGRPPRGLGRLILALDRLFYRRVARGILCLSDDIAGQLGDASAVAGLPLYAFRPIYPRDAFEGIDGPRWEQRPFRVLFAGRIEANKGVFDLVEVARRCAAGGVEAEFDLCGDGSALGELRRRIDEAGLGDRVRCHGHCDRDRMRRMLGDCQVVIVPTRSDFAEGYNKVVVEGVLAGRPVVTSSACPALGELRAAVVEVPVDDVGAYAEAVARLSRDEAHYRAVQGATAALAAPFYDPGRGWQAALTRALRDLAPGTAAATAASRVPGPDGSC